MNIQIQDKNVLNVMARFKERSEVGIKKYKTTLERTDLTTLEWLTHAQEEAMDFVLYLERLKHEYIQSKQNKMETKNNTGAIFKNDNKKADNHPDYKGKVLRKQQRNGSGVMAKDFSKRS
jgi:hypothetical protein